MNESQMRLRPGFLVLLGGFLFVVILPVFLPDRAKKRAMIVVTRVETRAIASSLKQRAIKMGDLNNIDDAVVNQAVFGTNSVYAERTNSQGRLLDWWKTPYQIKIESQTNFVVTSAGPDKKFGDKDDIIFNSVSNDFVKP